MNDAGKDSSSRKQEVLSRVVLHATPFLRLVDVEYTRPPWDKSRHWAMAERPTSKHGQPGFTDAVCMLCIVRKKGCGPQVVVVKQFRPALGLRTVELPAGLVDEGETFQEAALRELKEETGYTGTIISWTGVQYLSPGLTNECVRTVTVEVDGDAAQNNELREPSADDASTIAIELLPLSTLREALQNLEAEGFGIKAMLSAFAQGLAMTSRLRE